MTEEVRPETEEEVPAGEAPPAEEAPEAEVPPTEEVPADEVAAIAEPNPDDAPLHVRDAVQEVMAIGRTAKHSILKPFYRFGRRTLKSARYATEAFFEGALNERSDKK